MEQIGLYISVPIACFRVPRAREYFETFPCPPPATVYGMLLSLVGEVNRRVHEGAEIAVAMLSELAYSTVLRTLWRVKDKGEGLGLGNNRRPDFQELLADVRFGVWVRRGTNETNEVSLAQRLRNALDEPSSIRRFGGLSLGESTHMVDEVSEFKTAAAARGEVLVASSDGDLSLPIWVDHVGSKTRWQQYSLVDADLTADLPDGAWTTITRPAY
ncbi:MAG: type I-MYXAN CRISPR-associated protein Cas5/Cmx5/DevS [Acidobacteriota bacterium]|nr:type I-MYXAN CRISPR-associated protein Cas5/Cmx5/DevS [Acidobacteriota bacterium]